jgi:HAD superfamily hydrolase (TIGR01490 family)
MKKETIAAFDFDGTITKKDTFIEFIKFTKGKFCFYAGFMLFSPLLIAMKLKLYPNWKTKEKIFSYFYKGVSVSEFNNWGIKFSSKINDLLRPKVIESLVFHKTQKHKIIIISASIENWIKPWANKAEIDTVLATKIETDKNSVLTGKFSTKNCYGQEKVNRLLKEFPNRNEYKLVVYGDSKGDKKMLEFADEGFYNSFI